MYLASRQADENDNHQAFHKLGKAPPITLIHLQNSTAFVVTGTLGLNLGCSAMARPISNQNLADFNSKSLNCIPIKNT